MEFEIELKANEVAEIVYEHIRKKYKVGTENATLFYMNRESNKKKILEYQIDYAFHTTDTFLIVGAEPTERSE